MEFHLIDFIMHVLNVVVLFVLLRVFLYHPVSRFMAEREARFAGERAEIDAERKQAESLGARYAASLTDAKAAAEAAANERLLAAEQDANAIRTQAKADARGILAEARAQAAAEKKETLSELRSQTASLAVDLAGKILSREISENDNRTIIDGFFEQVG